MGKSGFKLKVFFGIMAVVMIPLFLVGVFSSEKSVTIFRQNSEVQSVRTATSPAASVEMAIAEQKRVLGCMAELFRSFGGMDIRFYGGAGIDELTASRVNKKIFNLIQNLGGDYESIFLGDTDGVLFAGASENEETPFYGVDISDTKVFQTVKEKGAPALGEASASALTGKPVMLFLAPILDQQENFSGVIGMTFKLDPLISLIGGMKIGETGYGFMVDRKGTLLAHPDTADILHLNIATMETLRETAERMTAGKSGTASYEFEGIQKTAGFAPVAGTGWSVAVTQNSSEFMTLADSIWKFNIVLSGVCFLLSVGAVLFLIHRFFMPVEKAVERINQVTGSLFHAAGEISSGCHTLAEAASEQTSTLHQTVTALSEVSGSIAENAENTEKTRALVRMSKEVVENTAGLMALLGRSMDAIEKSEEKTAAIVKTIEDIAFQTNLLALNAAVEAARAGGAGAGFGVMARQIRELACQATSAAKDSAFLIEETTGKVQEGAGLLKQAKVSFSNVAAHAERIGTSVENISDASVLQASAVDRVRLSMSDLEDIAHQYAAFAEQSATATVQMAQEVGIMSGISDSLATAVGGRLLQNNQLPAIRLQ